MDDVLVADLAAEQAVLDALLDGIDEAAWNRPTPAEGWNLKDQIAHLAIFDELTTSVISGDGEARFRDLAERWYDRSNQAMLVAPGAERTGTEVLTWWRAAKTAEVDGFRRVDASVRLPWGPNYMSAMSLCSARLMETWAHGLDCFAALGIAPLDTDRLRHICYLTYRAIPHAFRAANIALPGDVKDLRVEVVSPSGKVWRYGSTTASQRIAGSATEFARVGVRRMTRAGASTLEVDGPFAEMALTVLKAYL
jgi:uncharacterized protein (TIGR03084 family)